MHHALCGGGEGVQKNMDQNCVFPLNKKVDFFLNVAPN